MVALYGEVVWNSIQIFLLKVLGKISCFRWYANKRMCDSTVTTGVIEPILSVKNWHSKFNSGISKLKSTKITNFFEYVLWKNEDKIVAIATGKKSPATIVCRSVEAFSTFSDVTFLKVELQVIWHYLEGKLTWSSNQRWIKENDSNMTMLKFFLLRVQIDCNYLHQIFSKYHDNKNYFAFENFNT